MRVLANWLVCLVLAALVFSGSYCGFARLGTHLFGELVAVEPLVKAGAGVFGAAATVLLLAGGARLLVRPR